VSHSYTFTFVKTQKRNFHKSARQSATIYRPPLSSGDGAKISEIISSDPKAACAVDAARGDLTVLATASAAGHVEIIKALLDGGAVDTVVRGWSAACHAAYRGHAEALAALAAGLGVNAVAAPPGASMTPLLLACLKGHQTCAALILDAAPGTLSDRDPHGRTPLIVAASNGNVELIEYLVKRGAPIDDTSSEGKTALMWAIVGHKPFAVAALARLGASPEIRTKPNKEAPNRPFSQARIASLATRSMTSPMRRTLETRPWPASRST